MVLPFKISEESKDKILSDSSSDEDSLFKEGTKGAKDLEAILNMRRQKERERLKGNVTHENHSKHDDQIAVADSDKRQGEAVDDRLTNKSNPIPKLTDLRISPYAVKLTSTLNFVKTTDKSIPKCLEIKFSPGTEIKSIVILETINPHRFWFCEISHYEDHKKLRSQMSSFYNGAIESFKINAQDMKQGLTVAVLKGKVWRRATVLKLLYGTQYRLYLMDSGAVFDVDLSNIRYLKEDFLNYPALARRGVLAYVQPTHKYWTNDANQYFYKRVTGKKINAKFYCVSKENSYYMSLKIQADELVANEIIEKNFGKKDIYFLRRDPINMDETPFEDYENGKYADIAAAAALQATDSWIPNVKKEADKTEITFKTIESRGSDKKTVTQQISNSSRNSKTVFNRFSNAPHQQYTHIMMPLPNYPPPLFVPPPPVMQFRKSPPKFQMPQQQRSFASFVSNRNRFQHPSGNFQMFQGNQQVHQANIRKSPKRSPRKEIQLNASKVSSNQTIIASSHGSSPEKEKVIEVVKWQIEPQKYETMAIGSSVSISIIRVEKSNMFYFYNYDELLELSKFMDQFK
jgi:hypothetical protein